MAPQATAALGPPARQGTHPALASLSRWHQDSGMTQWVVSEPPLPSLPRVRLRLLLGGEAGSWSQLPAPCFASPGLRSPPPFLVLDCLGPGALARNPGTRTHSGVGFPGSRALARGSDARHQTVAIPGPQLSRDPVNTGVGGAAVLQRCRAAGYNHATESAGQHRPWGHWWVLFLVAARCGWWHETEECCGSAVWRRLWSGLWS
mmetsp:Transcript_20832/g.52899  ORF Transcript_20832/g.52899 Transcript_20832/m.52899 type:complete len:204 (+) Transcript_20832:951-1562(+)